MNCEGTFWGNLSLKKKEIEVRPSSRKKVVMNDRRLFFLFFS